MRKPATCICENEGEEQLCSNHTADQRLCFRYIYSTSSYIRKFKPLNIFVPVQPGLYRTWSETPKTGVFRDSAHIRLDYLSLLFVF